MSGGDSKQPIYTHQVVLTCGRSHSNVLRCWERCIKDLGSRSGANRAYNKTFNDITWASWNTMSSWAHHMSLLHITFPKYVWSSVLYSINSTIFLKLLGESTCISMNLSTTSRLRPKAVKHVLSTYSVVVRGSSKRANRSAFCSFYILFSCCHRLISSNTKKTRICELEDGVKFKHLLQPSKNSFCERIKARY